MFVFVFEFLFVCCVHDQLCLKPTGPVNPVLWASAFWAAFFSFREGFFPFFPLVSIFCNVINSYIFPPCFNVGICSANPAQYIKANPPNQLQIPNERNCCCWSGFLWLSSCFFKLWRKLFITFFLHNALWRKLCSKLETKESAKITTSALIFTFTFLFA